MKNIIDALYALLIVGLAFALIYIVMDSEYNITKQAVKDAIQETKK